MKIGVVGDTHDNLANVREIVRLFNGAGVCRVVHTGDITKGTTLDLFGALDAPLAGVFGNNDVEREDLLESAGTNGFTLAEPPLELRWSGRRIVVVHDPLDLPVLALGGYDLALHGHTHFHRCERTGDALVFNPGECAGHMQGYNAVGVVDLATLQAGLLKF